MKLYYYLLFRIYRFYTDVFKEKQIPLIYVSAISGVLIFFNLFSLNTYLEYKNMAAIFISNKFYIVIICSVIWLLNHLLFALPKKFLTYNFKKDALGGMLIVCYIALTAVSFIAVANKNREKIFLERAKQKQLDKSLNQNKEAR